MKRTAVISGNETVTEATVTKLVSSHFVYFSFRLLPFRQLSQRTIAKVHCNYIRLETSSVYEIILPLNNSPNQNLSGHAKSYPNEASTNYLYIYVLSLAVPEKVVNIVYFVVYFGKNLTHIFFESLIHIIITYKII